MQFKCGEMGWKVVFTNICHPLCASTQLCDYSYIDRFVESFNFQFQVIKSGQLLLLEEADLWLESLPLLKLLAREVKNVWFAMLFLNDLMIHLTWFFFLKVTFARAMCFLAECLQCEWTLRAVSYMCLWDRRVPWCPRLESFATIWTPRVANGDHPVAAIVLGDTLEATEQTLGSACVTADWN